MNETKKIQEAVKDMMKRITFTEDGHTYKDNENGTWLQGVSTVSSIIPKDWLSAWGSKEAVKALGFSDYEGDTAIAEEILAKIKACESVSEYLKILKDAKGASARKSKEALLDGKEGHAWLESYVKSKIRKSAIPPMPTGMLERPLTQFVEWEQANVDQWVLSEARVGRPDKGYAGTLDGMAYMKDGSLAIIDFKFASHISEDYYLQTAGYAACFEPYEIEVSKRIIVRLPKTLEKDEWDKTERKYKKVANTIEVEEVKSDYRFDRDTFFAALPVKQWVNAMQHRHE